MVGWSFRTYHPANGRDPVVEWYEALSPGNRATVRVRLEYLRQQPRQGWLRPTFDVLHGKECAGLGELRFKLNKVQWRLIGFFGPARQAFTIVFVAQEKGGKFVKKSTCKIAQSRRDEVMQNQERSHEWFF